MKDDLRDNVIGKKATKVAKLMVERYGISRNDAVVSFTQSETFRRLIVDKHMLSLTPEEILEIYNTEMENDDTELTSHDLCRMKIGISIAFAKRYNLSFGTVGTFFHDNGIYDYIDKCSNTFIFRTYPYIANHIAERYGVPKNDMR